MTAVELRVDKAGRPKARLEVLNPSLMKVTTATRSPLIGGAQYEVAGADR
jgi:hypothetical protein